MDPDYHDTLKNMMAPATVQESPNTGDRYSYSFLTSYVDPKLGYVIESRGPFKGVGPNQHLRSDSRIRQDVLVRLGKDRPQDTRSIFVEVRKGQVTLRGVVEDRHDRALAEELTFSVPGVIEVQNELRVVHARSFKAKSAQD